VSVYRSVTDTFMGDDRMIRSGLINMIREKSQKGKSLVEYQCPLTGLIYLVAD
jgi:hypothetical protein